MKTKYLWNIIFITFLSFLVSSCQDDYELGTINPPTNLQVDYTLTGATAENPYGDGSGEVLVSLSADNAMYYRIILPSGATQDAPNGMATLNFGDLGVNQYDLTAIAYGEAGETDSLDFTVEVLATYIPPAELVEKLVGNGDKVWRIKAEAQAHFGLGPVKGAVPTEWYGAGPFDKADVGMYDDRFMFKADNTFVHQTYGTIFGRIDLIDEVATGGEVDGADVYNALLDNYTETWQLSAPGDVETITISGKGFIGYYTGGDHAYRIFDRSKPNEIILSTTDGNNEFEWWFILTSEPATE